MTVRTICIRWGELNFDLLANCQIPACLFSPAKLNLGLSMVGRRADGYHLLQSLFWPIDFGDRIEISRAERFIVETRWAADAPFPDQALPAAEENLVTRAMKQIGGPNLPSWKIEIEKRIPLGGGLGGGSSNAGTLLRFTTPDAEVAQRLGADVPFFLDPVPTWVTGIGERRETIAVAPEILQRISFIVVVFPFPTLTPTVFRQYKESGRDFSRERAVPSLSDEKSLREYLADARNDLEAVVVDNSPPIARALAALRATPCVSASLSGSGSSLYAVYLRDADRAKSIKELTPIFRQIHCRGYEARTHTGTHF